MNKVDSYDNDLCVKKYLQKIEALNNGLSEIESENLKNIFINAARFIKEIGLLDASNKECALIFAKASGNSFLALKLVQQANQFYEKNPEKYNFDLLFSKENGWPNLDLKPEDILRISDPS